MAVDRNLHLTNLTKNKKEEMSKHFLSVGVAILEVRVGVAKVFMQIYRNLQN